MLNASGNSSTTINGTSRSSLTLAIGSKFAVGNDGTLYANGANVTNINAGNISAGSISVDRIKANVISSINQSTETVKIKASKVEIDGTAVFKAANAIPDTHSDNQPPSWYFTNYPQQSVTEFKTSSVMGLTGETYCYVTTVTGWRDKSGGYPKQTAQIVGKTYWRVGTSESAWGAWQETESTAGSQAKVDALEIGGRNLFLNSGSATLSGTANQNNTYTTNLTVSEFVPAGTVVTVSCQIDATNLAWGSSGNKRAGVEFNIGSSSYQYIGAWAGAALSESINVVKVVTGTWSGRVSKTFTLQYDLPKGRPYAVYVQMLGSGACTVSKPKLEIGNKATDWSPAPEDVAADIAAAQATANAAAPKANAVKRTQRIWYRTNASGAPSTPGTASSNWVTKADDGNDAWTKMHIAINSTHKYIYTCEQYEMANGTVGYTSVLLDNTITVIDGGNIITGTVTANKLNAANINASKSLTVGAMTDAAASTILNSNVVVGGRNLLPWSSPSEENLAKIANPTDYNSFVIEDGYGCYKITGGSMTGAQYASYGKWLVRLNADTMYTYSAWVKVTTTGSDTSVPFNFYSLGHFTVKNDASTATDKMHEDVVAKRVYSPGSVTIGEWTHITLTFTTNALDGSWFGVYPKLQLGDAYTVYIRDQKLEKGNKPTDWTPAPEDMATAESLAGTNESLYGAIADIGELSDQLVGTVSEQNKTIATIQTYLNSLRKDLDAEIQSRQQWLNFNSAEGLIIGATGSTFKTVTTNTSQQFRSGGTVLAETSGAEFVAPVMRSDQLLIGNWMWTRRDNGNLSLK